MQSWAKFKSSYFPCDLSDLHIDGVTLFGRLKFARKRRLGLKYDRCRIDSYLKLPITTIFL